MRANIVALVGRSTTLEFKVVRASPPVRPDDIQWLLNSNPLVNSRVQYSYSSDHLNATIANVTFPDEGVYLLVATTEAGTGNGSISVDVQGKSLGALFWGHTKSSDTIINSSHSICSAPPTISPLLNQTVLEGTDVIFHCSVIADPAPTFQWYFDNILLVNTSAKYSILSVAGHLHVLNVSYDDIGLYSCNASNIHGWDSAESYLEVQG